MSPTPWASWRCFCGWPTWSVMGGSLRRAGIGGHNPLEPARLGAPVVTGPDVTNWPPTPTPSCSPTAAAVESADAVGLPAVIARGLLADAADGASGWASAAAAPPPSARARPGPAAGVIEPLLPPAHEARHPPLVVRRANARRGLGDPRCVLTPISWIWAAATARRIAGATPVDPGVPVICVGNLTVGGAGKTPVAREAAAPAPRRGVAAHGLSRGYGGRLEGPVRVDPRPPHRRRRRRRAADAGAGLPRLGRPRPRRRAPAPPRPPARRPSSWTTATRTRPCGRRCRLVVVDGETRDDEWPFGDGAVFPAGPMREPLTAGLARADAVVVLLPADLAGADPELLGDLFGVAGAASPGCSAAAPAAARPAGRLRRHRQAVEGGARAWGRRLPSSPTSRPSPTTPPTTRSDLRFLADRADQFGAGLVTTEKDWARLPPAWRARVTLLAGARRCSRTRRRWRRCCGGRSGPCLRPKPHLPAQAGRRFLNHEPHEPTRTGARLTRSGTTGPLVGEVRGSVLRLRRSQDS